jgi:hypothetical protein
MEPSRRRQEARALYEELGGLLDTLLGRSPLLPGSLYEQKGRCGKPQCKCAQGPYRHRLWCLSFVEDGRSRTRTVPAAVRPTVAGLTAEYRRVRQARPAVEGFNHKNHYTRTTPCGHDFLRKLARDTPAAARDPGRTTSPPSRRPRRRREDARQKTLERRRNEAGPPAPAHTLEAIEYKWIEPSRVWDTCDVPLNVLTLPEGARRKALGKTRRLRRAQLRLPDLPGRLP